MSAVQNQGADPELEITPDYQLALDAVERGDPYIFISGKAGTGKTTLISHLRKTIAGNVVVLAPTGVAALQVRGVTIHSFFRLPPRLIFPEEDIKPLRSSRERQLYKDIRFSSLMKSRWCGLIWWMRLIFSCAKTAPKKASHLAVYR
jgi:superfamily II DNA or RNA helicase